MSSSVDVYGLSFGKSEHLRFSAHPTITLPHFSADKLIHGGSGIIAGIVGAEHLLPPCPNAAPRFDKRRSTEQVGDNIQGVISPGVDFRVDVMEGYHGAQLFAPQDCLTRESP